MTAGFCQKCHSDVQLANRIYSCQCGSTSDESYDSPPTWVFKVSNEQPISHYQRQSSGSSLVRLSR